jgi:hypothetical protein
MPVRTSAHDVPSPVITMARSLHLAFALSLATFAFACSSPPSDGLGNGEDDNTENDGSEKAPGSSTPAPAAPTGGDVAPAPAAPAPAPAAVIPMAKVHAGNVWDYAVTDANVWIATDTVVERAAPDGTGAAPIPSLSAVNALATDGTRVYAIVDKGSSTYEIRSVKADGTDDVKHLSWSSYYNGVPTTLAVNGARVFFTATKPENPSASMIVSIAAAPPLGGGSVPWTREEFVDSQFITPVFTADRLFTVDYHRQSAVRVSIVDATASVDFIREALPTAAAGIATNATDVFTRTAKGIAKAAVNASGDAATTVIVPSTACSVVDPGNGSASVLEDTLVADGATLYAACRAGANVEIRAYDVNGTQQKVVATTPYTGALTRLRLTKQAIYWVARGAAADTADELWRAGR